ncbi:SRPBCC domain-containing protein [Mastigocoleus sp. MO_188.B34]|uniref:SRPBCC family protein n=1 Tax=Mastigocoleus sp. MO_188.B34 TaxID=3036635 RepID=UPI002638320C|nr:SRPBCC domain-containing protein [Mastigocoleus sp. MO_188.B34]MDJ0693802.1 SRPBCC domain-containing protein [Mastigocoleus sp. MO_188.B34]
MLKTLNLDVVYPHQPQRVWEVITDSRALAAWLMENNFEPKLGHRFQFKHTALPGTNVTIDCEVIELDEPKRISYTWKDSLMCQPSIVTWTLEPVEDGTRLRLQHKSLGTVSFEVQQPRYSQPLQNHFMSDSQQITQTLITPVTHNLPLQSTPVRKYERLNYLVLNFFLNGEWNYKLNKKLPQVLVSYVKNL